MLICQLEEPVDENAKPSDHAAPMVVIPARDDEGDPAWCNRLSGRGVVGVPSHTITISGNIHMRTKELPFLRTTLAGAEKWPIAKATPQLYHCSTIPSLPKLSTPVESNFLIARHLSHVATWVEAKKQLVEVEIVVDRLTGKTRRSVQRIETIFKRVGCVVDDNVGPIHCFPALRHMWEKADVNPSNGRR